MELEAIENIVLEQLTSLNITLPQDQKFEVNLDTVLFGNGSSIDSLSLVSVIVNLEMVYSDEHDIVISLTDDRAMTREVSPFESVRTLADYIHELINEES